LAAKGKSVVDAGGIVVEILETKAGGPTAKGDLDAWITKSKLPVTSVIDPPGTGTPTFTALGQRETTYILDLKTMKILRHIVGDTTGLVTPGVVQGINEILVLLKK
jgi:hypothetical protein